MDAKVASILNLDQKSAVEELKEYLDTLTDQQISSYVCKHVKNGNFTVFWNYLLQTFDETEKSQEKRLKIATEVLNTLEENVLSTMHCYTLVTRLCVELPNFSTQDLVVLCKNCLKYIQQGNSSQMIWKDILPEIINVINVRPIVDFEGSEISGADYREKILDSLLSMQWEANILTPLATMFIDIQLMKDEHSKVVSKLCQGMNTVTCTELPSLVYQLLKLCRSQNGRNIFMQLQSYFNIHIYSKPFTEINSNIELIDDASNIDYINAESTILYHIHQSASLGYDAIKDYINSLKHLTKAPEHILHPFQLTVLLSIGSICFYEETVFDLIKSAISRTLNEENKKANSHWLSETLEKGVEIEQIFLRIISLCEENRDFVLQGLVGISFSLLSIGVGLGKEDIAEKQWKIAKIILYKLIKSKRHMAQTIVQHLCTRVTLGQNAYSNIGCLHLLISKLPLIIMENQTHILDMINTLMQVPYSTAINILDAVLPLVKISPTIRDHLILLLRKALYSRSTHTRQAAVSGFLKLLKKLKISNLGALSSQTLGSGHSILTQISLTSSSHSKAVFSNEALCLEVIGILRKCFSQQADVRLQLYSGLYNAIVMNPELGENVFDVIWSHFTNYQVIDEEILPPLKFEKVTITKDVKVSLVEPLGTLILVIGLMLLKILDQNLDEPDEKFERYTKFFDSLCEKMSRCELANLDFDDSQEFDDSPETQNKLITIQEVIYVYEALIGYKISEWNKNTENADVINSLFQKYNYVVQFQKDFVKPKKADKRKKKNADANTQNNTTMNLSAKSLKTKNLGTILNLQIIEKVLELLYDKVDWASTPKANILKTKVEFHRYIMQSTITLINANKAKKVEDKESREELYTSYLKIGVVLYKFIIFRLEEFVDFDLQTAALATECFHLILVAIQNCFKEDFNKFLQKIGENLNEDLYLSKFLNKYESLLKLKFAESEGPDLKTLRQNLISTYMLLCSHIPPKSQTALQTLDWLKEFITKDADNNKIVSSNLITVAFNLNRKFRESTVIVENVLLNVADIMGTHDEIVANFESMELINEQSAQGALQNSVGILKTMLDDVDWVILRLKSEFAYIQYPGCQIIDIRREELLKKEKNVCVQICLIGMQICIVSNITVPAGTNLEGTIKLLIHFYNTLSVLTKYFMSRSSKLNAVFQKAKFEHVVKLAGKTLSPIIYKLILFIDECQKQSGETKSKKKDPNMLKNKVLKDTKLIPKIVYEIEEFSRNIIQISNKTKVDLTKYVGQGTARDFRLMQLKDVVEKTRRNSDEDDETLMDTTRQTTRNGSDDSDSDGAAAVTPKKKSKK